MTIECVPNFSEGRDRATIHMLAETVKSVRGVTLLDTTSDADHNRTVLTFTGVPDAVGDAAFAVAKTAVARIDLTQHSGVHPRLGAVDVIPFVPLDGATLDDCASVAHRVGKRLWQELGVPVYFYEAAALRPECARLESVRSRAQAGLPPDVGTGRHATAGASVVGARRFLVAWNINLESEDLAAAREIARSIRESSGGLRAVKAIGLPLESRHQVQVSINLVDFETTPLWQVFEKVAELCRERRIRIAGSELIGMIPQGALDSSAGHDLRWLNFSPRLILRSR